jgi:PAS domain S-box-containing protein
MQIRPTSLRFGILLTVLATVIPVLGLSAYHAISVRQQLQEDHRASLVRLTEQTAASLSAYLEGTRQLLVAISHFEAIRERRPAEAAALLEELRVLSPLYVNFALIRGDGTVAASTNPMPPGLQFSDRPWFRRLQTNRRFGLGEFLVSQSTGKPSISLACALPDQAATGPLDSVNALLDLQAIQQVLENFPIRPNTDLLLLDRQGTILCRRGVTISSTPQQLPGWADLPHDHLPFTTADGDGQSRVYYFAPVSSMDEGLWVGAGMMESEVRAEARRTFLWSFTLTSLLTIALVLLGWWVGDHQVLQPIRQLSVAAASLTRGHWDARARIEGGAAELRALGDTFDTMAGHLHREMELLKADTSSAALRYNHRSAELVAAQQQLKQAVAACQITDVALRQSEATSRAFLESINEAALLLSPEGKVLMANQPCAARLGCSLKELIGSNVFTHTPPAVLDKRREALATVLKTRRPITYEDRNLDRQSFIQATPVLDAAGNVSAIAVLSFDITERKHLEEQLRHSVAALEQALNEVKTLSGLLPICAGCKKIRDDKGYWREVEQYIQQRTDAEFSHGLCPDCMRRLYPEYAHKIGSLAAEPAAAEKPGDPPA